jgi:sugar phosphate isomerase/epimerase
MHTDFLTLQKRMAPLAEAAHELGATYVVLPALDTEHVKTLDDWKRTADAFNAIGASALHHGVKFAYHNHGYGLRETQGVVPLHLLMRETDRNSVFFELDTYWTTAGGGDPVELLKAYPARYKMLHLKDMKKLVHFKGDGSNPSQWEALFPYMTSVGDGVIDMKGIVRQAQRNGVEYYFVEEDNVANPQVALKRSADYLLSE